MDRERGRTGGPGPFVTRHVRTRPDGAHELHTSRRHRKGLGAIIVRDGDPFTTAVATRGNWRRPRAPHRLSWWTAVLFMVGSTHFIAGGFLACCAPDVRAETLNWIFFAGSIFFTAAAYLQLAQAINGDVADAGTPRAKWRWFAFLPRNLGYLASLVQFAGTILFNFDTADSMIEGLSWVDQDLVIWTPDMAGCICFLVASVLACLEVSEGRLAAEVGNLSWWIAAINLLGSALFQVSALYSFVGPRPDHDRGFWLASFFTMLGAVCFLGGAYLCIPEATGHAALGEPVAPTGPLQARTPEPPRRG